MFIIRLGSTQPLIGSLHFVFRISCLLCDRGSSGLKETEGDDYSPKQCQQRPLTLTLEQIIMEAPYSPKKEDLSDAREVNVLAELYDALDSRPRDIEIREVLIGAWLSIGESGKSDLITRN